MKLIIAGGRDFNDLRLVHETIGSREFRQWLDLHGEITEIVSGKARGADTQGELYAQSTAVPVSGYPADWDKYGRAAGFKRNREMAEYGDCLLAFWDGASPGTKSMIQLMIDRDKPTYIVSYKGEVADINTEISLLQFFGD